MLDAAAVDVDVGGCQNYGPFLGTLNIRCLKKEAINFESQPCVFRGYSWKSSGVVQVELLV